MSKIVFGDAAQDRSKRYWREWHGGLSETWWFAKRYKTRFFATVAAILHYPGARQRVIDTREAPDAD